jgi:hypothetical protein
MTDIRRILLMPFVVGVSMCPSIQNAAGQSQSERGVAPNAEGRTISELNVSITVFEPGVPADLLEQRRLQVLPNIREVEAILLPFMLRQTLVEADEWGAVRVLPAPDYAAELLLSGEIVRSDGNALELRIRAIDAGGFEWLDKVYVSAAATGIGQNGAPVDLYGYQALFESIAEDLRVARALLDDKALSNIIDISFLRYAHELAPSVFSGYLRNGPDGTFAIQRLPAKDDPMSERIERVREVEYQLIDTVDEKFQELHAEIGSIYDLWLDYRRQVARFESNEAQRVQTYASNAPRGSYEAIRSLYDNYRLARMQEQRRDDRAQAFSNEVGPTVERIEARVAELENWLVQQYEEWRRILTEMFARETGLES